MKIAISSTGKNLESEIDPRFGRCGIFLIVDTETLEFRAVANSGESSAHGAGIEAAQRIVSQGIQSVITGHVGPNAHMALSRAGLEVYTMNQGTVKDAVEAFNEGRLARVNSPTVGGHFGQGGGRRGNRPGV
jgi:predicted Fe-Mo cluster-binding NifX family protein